MSSQSVLGTEEEAVGSVSTQEAVRIVGLSVRRMEPDKGKALRIKLKLNGATHKKLRSANMTIVSERCTWNFEDLPLNLQAGLNLAVKLQHEKSMPWDKPVAQVEIPFDQARSFLDSALHTRSIEYQVSTNPEMWLHLDSSAVTLESHVNVVVQNSKEIRSALERLGKWQVPATTALEVSTAISEAHPYTKAALGCLNVIHRKLQAQVLRDDQIRYLIDACLRTITMEPTGLRFNICGLESSTLLNADVPDIGKMVNEGIPSHLSYSCFFWADHLSSVPFNEGIMEIVKDVIKDKFLYWLEVMSLSNEMNRVDSTLKMVLEWSKTANDSGFLGFLQDAVAFVRAFGKPIAESAPHIYISALPFSPMQSLVAQHFLDKYPRTITVTTGRPTHWPSTLFVTEHHMRVDAIAFSPDQRYFASCGNGVVHICDAENGNIVSSLFKEQLGGYNTSFVFCPGGHRVALGLADGTVRVRDVETGVESLCLQGSGGDVMCVAYSNDGGKIATYSEDGIIMIWDAKSGEKVGGPLKSWGVGLGGWKAGQEDKPYLSCGQTVIFSTDGQSLISGSCLGFGSVGIWDVHNGECTGLFSLEAEYLWAVALSPDGRFIAGGSVSGTVWIWSVETRKPSITLEHGDTVNFLAYSTNGKRLVSGSFYLVRVWDLPTSQIVFTVSTLEPKAALSANGMKLVLGSSDGTVRMWDLGDVKVSSLLGPGDTSDSRSRGESGLSFQGEGNCSLSILPKQVNSIVFSPCGKKLVSISHDGIRFWDVNTGEPLLKPISRSLVADVVFSRDGEWIISLSEDGSICFWDTEGKLGRESPALGFGSGVWDQLAFLPNGRSPIYCAGKQVCIWDAETMEHPVQRILPESDASTQSFTLSPDGTKIIGENRNREMQMWSTELEPLEPIPVRLEGLEPITVEGRRSFDVRFSQSGKLVYLVSDATLKVWDVKTGRNVATRSFERIIHRAAVSSDDRHICVFLYGGSFQIFDVGDGRICGAWYDDPVLLIRAIRFSPDGKKIASFSGLSGMIKIWDISDFTKSSGDHSPQQPRDPHLNDLCRFENGWVKTADGELLFWVPQPNRDGLWWPRSTAVIGENSTKLDLTKFEHGNNWQKCRDRQ